MEQATFGAGCFWGVEDTFRVLPGVIDTAVGFMGGTVAKPTYEQVCTGATGHAEVVHLMFDPSSISYEELLKVFFANHNPTQMNRQGPDIGDQYRSVIFFHSPAQEAAAIKKKANLEKSGTFKKPIATQIVRASPFYRAEEYHQKYHLKNGGACRV